MHSPQRAPWLSFALAFLLFACSYYLLLSPMPVDDMARYVDELGANQFFWDLGHVWLQPAALLIFRLLGRSVELVGFLEALNVLSVALGAAVFFDTLRRFEVGVLRAMLALLLLGASFNLLCLGPTAHIKLMVFPTLALALRHAVFWERQLQQHPAAPSQGLAWAAGIWFGIGANLLISILPMALFVGIFMLIRGFQARLGLLKIVRAVLPFALGVLGAWLLFLGLAYALALNTGTTSGSFADFLFKGIAAKQDLHVGYASFKEMPFRFTFSLIFNFVFLPNLGGLGRAALLGYLGDWHPYAWKLLGEGGLAALTLFTLLAILGSAVWALRRSASALAMPLAFVLGATLFSAYYNLNDPEHWFQFSLPIVFMAALNRRRWIGILVFWIWLPLLVANNLGLYGIPKARFAMLERQQAISQAIGPQGLYIGFAAYPGEPDTSLLDLQGVDLLRLDLLLSNDQHGDVDKTIAAMLEKIDASLARGGRVWVFRALDAGDWRGPVMAVSMSGLTKGRLREALARRYTIQAPVELGGFAGTELTAKP